jgi:hypothetical protein
MLKRFIKKSYDKYDNASYKELVKEFNKLLKENIKLQNDKIKLHQIIKKHKSKDNL